MSQSAERARFQFSADFMFWILGWTVYNVADTFIQNQSTIDVLARISTALIAIALPLAWNAGRKWYAALFLLNVLSQVFGGSPTPRVHSTAMLITDGVIIGLGVLCVFIGLYQRLPRGHRPDASAIPHA